MKVDISKIRTIYFVGIGGIGMSALARYFKSRGCTVSGYDKTESALTKTLVMEGISIHYHDNLELIPMDAELVVYTPAIPEDHAELNYYRSHEYPVWKRSEVLGEITKNAFNICVAGTHGKTTITTMIAHILRDSDYGCNAFLGGISVNYDTNFWSSERDVCVVEADEYDRSFLKLSPDRAVITAMDPDHLDIYGTTETMQDAFVEFAKKVKKNGLLLTKKGLQKEREFGDENHITYSLDKPDADAHAARVRTSSGGYRFDVVIGRASIGDVVLHMGGTHNVENAVAAITVAHGLDIEEEKIRKAIATFRGVKRRFEYILRDERHVLIDDYAHHPNELSALIRGAKELFPGLRCTIVFQPHLYSRTRDLADDFARSLDLADQVILLPIYPARELAIEGISSNLILEKMRLVDRHLMSKDQLMEWINREDPRLLVTAGAGDIDNMIEPIKKILTEKY
ncbi:MAG TPA: UDP-N-acetylmuramate--L-alanine ligase [Puia sp.]|nr:UDP-N-acetylmuramate--L-alanine ligase [Puia sp.]